MLRYSVVPDIDSTQSCSTRHMPAKRTQEQTQLSSRGNGFMQFILKSSTLMTGESASKVLIMEEENKAKIPWCGVMGPNPVWGHMAREGLACWT